MVKFSKFFFVNRKNVVRNQRRLLRNSYGWGGGKGGGSARPYSFPICAREKKKLKRVCSLKNKTNRKRVIFPNPPFVVGWFAVVGFRLCVYFYTAPEWS